MENLPVEIENQPVGIPILPVEMKNLPVEMEYRPVEIRNLPVEPSIRPVGMQYLPVASLEKRKGEKIEAEKLRSEEAKKKKRRNEEKRREEMKKKEEKSPNAGARAPANPVGFYIPGRISLDCPFFYQGFFLGFFLFCLSGAFLFLPLNGG